MALAGSRSATASADRPLDQPRLGGEEVDSHLLMTLQRRLDQEGLSRNRPFISVCDVHPHASADE